MATSKLWLVARYEYLKAVRRRSFLLVTLGLPFLLIVIGVIVAMSSMRAGAEGPVGYVDVAGIVTVPAAATNATNATNATGVPAPGSGAGTTSSTAGSTPRFLPYSNEADAQAALKAGDVQAFYVIQSDYLTSGKVELFFMTRTPSDRVQQAFSAFLADQLVAGLPAPEQERVLSGPAKVEAQELGRPVEEGSTGFLRILLPMVIGILFVIAVMGSAGYLLQAVTDEKENRTIEVMATSLSPEQLIVGKSAGLIGVGLTQVLTWTVIGVVGLIVLGNYFEPLRQLQVPWSFVGITALFFIPAFVLEAGIITSIGAAVTDLRQGQQITGVLQFLFFIPFFFFALVLSNPDNPILVILTLLPPTSFFTIALRWGATAVPWWQIALAWVLLAAAALAMLQVAPRVFRRGMLRYGQHMKLGGLVEAARSRG